MTPFELPYTIDLSFEPLNQNRNKTMATIAYYRVSTDQQTIDSQKAEIEQLYNIDKSFEDVGVSGTVKADDRKGFTDCMAYVREGDTLIVWSLDRLGRDSIDVQTTIAALKTKQVNVIVKDMGVDLNSDAGELLVVIMSKVAEMERKKILARTAAGRSAAKDKGVAFGRPTVGSLESVVECRIKGMSIKETAETLSISESTVKRLTAAAKKQEML